jgi:integrase
MRNVYPKDGRLYLRVKVAGKWKGVRTDFVPGQESQARALLDQLLLRLAEGTAITGGLGPVRLSDWSAAWLKERAETVSTWKNDEGVMRLHVLPVLGAKRLDEVSALDVVELVKAWRKTMAPKSVHNAYSSLSACFRDARIAGHIPANSSPCILTKRQLGSKDPADSTWRMTAIFTRDELEALISDERIPMDRRVLYAVLGIGGLRHGEASKMTWANCGVQPEPKPLGMMWVLGKGGVNRPVPIHPTLAGILAEWRMSGWREFMGRRPLPEDMVFPMPPSFTRPGGVREKWNTRDGMEIDLKALGFRHRRTHDLRRTMISLARSDGARKDILRRGTHKPPREVIEDYTTFEWDVVCAEFAKLRIFRRQTGKLISIPVASVVAANGFATPSATTETQPMATTGKHQEPTPGLEPGDSIVKHIHSALSTKQPDETSGGYENHPGANADGRGESALDARSNVAARLSDARDEWLALGDEDLLSARLLTILAIFKAGRS